MALDKLGNNIGYIYITNPSNGIISSWNNTPENAKPFLYEALIAAPLSGEILASASVTITNPGSITNITVNGVGIVGGVTSTGVSNAALAADAATKINSALSTPDYVAYSSGAVLYIQPIAGTGSTPNGFVVVVSYSGGGAGTSTNMAGGAPTTGIYSTAFNGKRFYIYADAAAVEGVISGATEISREIIQRGTQSGLITSTATIATGVIPLTRQSAVFGVIADTESAAASDDLDTITTSGFVDGDVIFFRGANGARVISVKSGTGNIITANAADFISDGPISCLQLQYVSSTDKWYEISRSPGLDFSASSVRASGVVPWAVPGITSTVLTNGGGTITLTPGTSKGILYLSGTPNLAASWSVVGAGSPIDGDTFYVYYRAVPTLNGNTITIFGSLLTATQAVSGKILVRATYSTTLTAYTTVVIQDFTAADWATVASVAAKEDYLGLPAGDGYGLYSNLDGTRYFAPSPNSIYQICNYTLSSAQILDLYNTPVVLVAPPAGYYALIVPSPIFLQNNFNSIPYSVTTAVLQLETYLQGTRQLCLTPFIAASQDVFTEPSWEGAGPTSALPGPDTGISIYADNENPTTGNGEIFISFVYRLIPAI